MELDTKHSMYLIYTDEMENPFIEGYQGVTSMRVDERIQLHKKSAANGSEYYVHRMMREHPHYKYRTFASGLSKRSAYALERQNRNKMNMGWNTAKGGGGGNVVQWTTEMKEKQSEVMKKHWDDNPELRQKMSERVSGEKNPSYGRTGDKHPLYGKKMPEHSERMSGENHPLYGIKRPEHGERMSGENHPLYGLRKLVCKMCNQRKMVRPVEMICKKCEVKYDS